MQRDKSTDGGHIELIIGPMFSGKSTELQRRIRRHLIAKHDCVVVKHSRDTRYSVDSMATHDKQLISAISTTSLDDIYEELSKHDIIGIDEGQFFPEVRLYLHYRWLRSQIIWRNKERSSS